MIEKLKQLLGEELANKVQEVLGDVELAIMNDGTVVRADKHDSLKGEHKALTERYENDIAAINTKLSDATTNAADYDGLKGTLEQMKVDNVKAQEQHRIEMLKIKKDNRVDLELLKNNVDEQYLSMVKREINMDNLTFDGDNLIGLTDSIGGIKEKFPKLFGEMVKTGTTPQPTTEAPQVGKRALLVKDYNEAQMKGDARAMMALQAEISKLPKI